MKNILFSMSLLGILINPLTAGIVYNLTPDPADSYTINNPLPNGVTAYSINDVLDWLQSEHDINSAEVMKGHSNIGTMWSFSGTKLVDWTTLAINPWGAGAYGDVIVTEDNSTNPSTFKFEGVVGNDYQGAPQFQCLP